MAFKVKSFEIPYSTGAAVALSTVIGDINVFDMLIQAPRANTGICYIGDSSTQVFQLANDTAVSMGDIFASRRGEAFLKASEIYVKVAAAGDKITGLYPDEIL